MSKNNKTEIVTTQTAVSDNYLNDYLQITEEVLRKKYLTRLSELPIAPIESVDAEADLIENVRLYHIEEMIYEKGESVTEKFTTVFNTLSTYDASVFIILDSDGYKTDFYIGVRNLGYDNTSKRSTVTLGDTLKNTLIGHFPGIRIKDVDRKKAAILCQKIEKQQNITSVSVVGDSKNEKEQNNDKFVQGLEKLALAMQGRKYTGLIVATNQSPQMVQMIRQNYQEQYTKLSQLQKTQISRSESNTESSSKSFFEMDGKEKAAMIGSLAMSLGGVVAGAALAPGTIGAVGGAMIGGQITGQLGGFINKLAPDKQISKATTESTSTTIENKTVTDILQMLDDSIKKTKEYDSYGMWSVAGYFVSDDMSTAEIAASNYRSLMNGENSGREVSAINSWRALGDGDNCHYLTTYLSRFEHPQFIYGTKEGGALTDATTWISGKELGIHLGLPRATVPGLPVIKHAEFGKEVNTYQLVESKHVSKPEETMVLGKIFDLGQVTNKPVELDNKSLNMHTFITGSTGSGKSNTVYQMLSELHHDNIPFLVIEPAKGEYKDVFGNWDDVNVYSTNPMVAELININPFMFPNSIHVLEHVDGLVEIFSACWPMYDAMPAFFKDAILKSYEEVGWDLGSSTFDGDEIVYPNFDTLVEQLNNLIEKSDYASDIKSNYRGALVTRVKSLTIGLNKYMFTSTQTPYEKLFDENCILDISRIKSTETKALIMGLMVYILNEYRADNKDTNNSELRHITVLEEAHNLLKNTAVNNESGLVGKSVEMLTQTIAEIRTYGEGFIIVDQSPSSVDISAIKNTNTKIVLRTPEAHDREAIGRSIGLTDDQINEIAKLPCGVAVVYQNNWTSPVLAMVDKADVEEDMYVYNNPKTIKPLKEARTELLFALMHPWFKRERVRRRELLNDLETLDMSTETRMMIEGYVDDYAFLGGNLFWLEEDIPKLQKCIKSILSISDTEYYEVIGNEDAEGLRNIVEQKLSNANLEEVNEICNVLTKVVK